eukprot:6187169-Pleurochrysis_carterae.AAC.4
MARLAETLLRLRGRKTRLLKAAQSCTKLLKAPRCEREYDEHAADESGGLSGDCACVGQGVA